MAHMVRVQKLDGTYEIVNISTAKYMRDQGQLMTPTSDGQALTLAEVWGDDFERSDELPV